MHPCDNNSYATILNIGSYSSSIFLKSRLSAEFKKICLMTNRLNPRLARAKLNADSVIARWLDVVQLAIPFPISGVMKLAVAK